MKFSMKIYTEWFRNRNWAMIITATTHSLVWSLKVNNSIVDSFLQLTVTIERILEKQNLKIKPNQLLENPSISEKINAIWIPIYKVISQLGCCYSIRKSLKYHFYELCISCSGKMGHALYRSILTTTRSKTDSNIICLCKWQIITLQCL